MNEAPEENTQPDAELTGRNDPAEEFREDAGGDPVDSGAEMPEPEDNLPAEDAAVEETVEADSFFTRQRLIVGLLVLCNLIAAIALGTFEAPVEVTPGDLNTIDLAIEEKLQEYNLPARQIKTENVRVDSHFTRKIVKSGVPKGLSRTMMHLELHQELSPLGIRVPASVHFPERDLNIHFMLGGTIVRTLVLRNDTSLKVLSYPGSVIFYAEGTPDSDALQQLRTFGETFLLAGRVESIKEVEVFLDEATSFNPNRILLWVSGTEVPGYRFDRFYNELIENLRKSAPSTKMLLFSHAQASNNRGLWKTLEALEWPVLLAPIDAIQPENLNEEEFERVMERFNKDALTGQNQLLVLPLTESYVGWLKQALPELKKNGLRLVEPKPVRL